MKKLIFSFVFSLVLATLIAQTAKQHRAGHFEQDPASDTMDIIIVPPLNPGTVYDLRLVATNFPKSLSYEIRAAGSNHCLVYMYGNADVRGNWFIDEE